MLNDPQRLVYILDGRPTQGATLDELLRQVNQTIVELEEGFFAKDEVQRSAPATQPGRGYGGEPARKVIELAEALDGLSVQELSLLAAATCLRMSEEITGEKAEISHITEGGGAMMSFVTEFSNAPAQGEPALRDTIRVYAMLRDHASFGGEPGQVAPIVAVERLRVGSPQVAEDMKSMDSAAQAR